MGEKRANARTAVARVIELDCSARILGDSPSACPNGPLPGAAHFKPETLWSSGPVIHMKQFVYFVVQYNLRLSFANNCDSQKGWERLPKKGAELRSNRRLYWYAE